MGGPSDTTAPGDMAGKVVLVTGANSGIGKETAVALAARGASVTITARNAEKGAAALAEIRHRSGNDSVELGSLDLGRQASIHEFAAWYLDQHESLHVLVNNAGLVTGDRRETVDGFEEMFGVNHLGHFTLTNLLVDRLVASAPARVVVVSSFAHRWAVRGLRFDDLQSERRFTMFGTYGRSKLANILHAAELARRLEGTGVTVNAVHPGSIKSGFAGDGDTRLLGELVAGVGGLVMRTPAQGAKTSVLLASSPDPRVADVTGGYYSHGRRWRPSRAARSAEAARRLWDESERLIAAASSPS